MRGGEEPVQFFEIHRLVALATLEEVAEAVKFGVGQRFVLGKGLHGEPSTGGSFCFREHSTRHSLSRAEDSTHPVATHQGRAQLVSDVAILPEQNRTMTNGGETEC